MANVRFVARQVRRIERQKATVTAVAAAGTLDVTVNSKIIRYVCTASDTTATAASALASLLRNADDSEFKQFNISVDTSVTNQINFDCTDSSRFFSVNGNTAITVAGGGGATITSAVVQAGLSPRDANEVLNWSTGALPAAAGDTLHFEDAPYPAQFDWASLAANSYAGLIVYPTFAGNGIGLPKFAPEGYEEYRGGRMTSTGIAALTLNLPSGAGFEAYRFNVGAAVCAVVVNGTGGGSAGQEPVDWVGTHANNTVEVIAAGMRIAPYQGDAATVLTLKAVQGAVVYIGAGTTLGTVQMNGSALDLNCAVTTFTQDGDEASTVVRGAGAITTLTIDGGSVFHNGTGTITTCTVGPDATLDFSGSKDPITITNKLLIHKGARVWDPFGRVILPAGYQTVRCTQDECTINFGLDRSYTVA